MSGGGVFVTLFTRIPITGILSTQGKLYESGVVSSRIDNASILLDDMSGLDVKYFV